MLTSLYLHIPFCDHICTYCDFHKQVATNTTKEAYIDALCLEIIANKEHYDTLQTIYIGGGTPLSLDISLLEKLLKTLNDVLSLSMISEFTIETNPNNITSEKINILLQYGVNRVSIGVQTFHPHHLRFMNRDHQVQDVHSGIALLKSHQFPNISVDMMFALPKQTMDELHHDIEQVLLLDVDHISYYSLILEEQSVLYHRYKTGTVDIIDEELEGEMYVTVINRLTDHGYHQYEISNFAKDNKESMHNKTYWQYQEYLGLGSGAHSFYNGERRYHKRNVQEYIKRMQSHQFSQSQMESTYPLGDYLLMGLRLTKGVHIKTVETTFNVSLFHQFPALQKYIAKEYLSINNGYLALTRKGLLVGNIIFQEFLEE